jgi:hypothetical protein
MPAIEIIRLRRDTAANWTAANPTLSLGEPGVETDTGFVKIGDGSTAWTSLAYAAKQSQNAPLASPTFTGKVNLATYTNSSPADGDLWFDGTDLNFRVGGVTKTVTLT